MDLWQYEKDLQAKGINIIGGTDEAGRGPLYGPVVAACVVLPQGFELEGLNDSKKLTEKKRNIFYDYIVENTIYGIGIVSPEEIDKKHPEYGFKNHKGYPTKKHLEAINKYGLIDGYRKTYGPIKNYIENGHC